MGALIDKYLDKNRNILSNWQMIGVTWHAGQMYTFDNRYEMAKSRFIHCINPNEPENAPILWNDYVYATLAFLNNDMAKLKFHRDKIADGPILKRLGKAEACFTDLVNSSVSKPVFVDLSVLKITHWND
ncbi:hypothetical protein [Legionella spiritensis]|nr:hypothetical protein [Legionella spiritensis]